MDDVIIRAARREDCQSISKLSREIADFHKDFDCPQVDYKVFEKDAFDTERPLFGFFVAEYNDSIIGYAHYHYTHNIRTGLSMCLQDLYVTEKFRNHCIGSKLIDAVAKKAIEDNCDKLELLVTTWNPALNFYKRKGAVDWTDKESWHVLRYDHNALLKMASSRQ